uniref:RNA-dependent RNA polymerase n=1 Tax=Macrostomum lignano TaxID=282301 RepID=A0A1I8FC89_9PLAT
AGGRLPLNLDLQRSPLVIRRSLTSAARGLKDLIRSLEARCFRVSRVDESSPRRDRRSAFPRRVSGINVGCGGLHRQRRRRRRARSKGQPAGAALVAFCCQWSFRHRGCPVFACRRWPKPAATRPRVGDRGRCQVRTKGEPRLALHPGRADEDSARAFAVELYRGCLNIRRCWMYRMKPSLTLFVDGNRFLDAQATCQLAAAASGQRLLTPAGWLALRRRISRLPLLGDPPDAGSKRIRGGGCCWRRQDQTVYEDIDRPQAPKRPPHRARFDCRCCSESRLETLADFACAAPLLFKPTRRDIDDKIDEGDEMGLLRMAAVLRQLQTLRAFLADPAARLETQSRPGCSVVDTGGRRFLLVVFTDEAGNSCGMPRDKNRFTRVLMDGLLLAGRRFRLLSASGSQLRSQRCLFVDAEDPYLARLALFHTGDKPAVELPLARVGRVQDRPAGNGDLLTDGCGKISSRLAAEMADRLGYSVSATPRRRLSVPVRRCQKAFWWSSIQTRIPSFWRLDREVPVQHGHPAVRGAARQSPAVRLNREAITLLESLGRRLPQECLAIGFGIKAAQSCQEAALARASEALTAGTPRNRRCSEEYIEPHQVTRVASRFDPGLRTAALARLSALFPPAFAVPRCRTLPVAPPCPWTNGCRGWELADPTGFWPRARSTF